MTQYDNFEVLDKLTNVVSKFMCCYAKIDHKPPVAKMSNCDRIYTASAGLLNLANKAEVGDKLHPCLKTGSSLFNFATQANNITKLLLGQQLLQNNSVFNKDMIIQAQGDCNKLTEIISDLKSPNSKNSTKYVLKNGILYKIKPLFGNVIHYRLCLPAYLAEAILENHHTRLSHHFNAQFANCARIHINVNL